MNRNEKRVLEALKQGYRIHKRYGKRGWCLKKTFKILVWQRWDGCYHTAYKIHVLSGVSQNTVSWLVNHCYTDYIMEPFTFYYELREEHHVKS